MTPEQFCAALGQFAAQVALSYDQPHRDLTAGLVASVALAEACGGDYPERFKEAIRPLVVEMRDIVTANNEEERRNASQENRD